MLGFSAASAAGGFLGIKQWGKKDSDVQKARWIGLFILSFCFSVYVCADIGVNFPHRDFKICSLVFLIPLFHLLLLVIASPPRCHLSAPFLYFPIWCSFTKEEGRVNKYMIKLLEPICWVGGKFIKLVPLFGSGGGIRSTCGWKGFGLLK